MMRGADDVVQKVHYVGNNIKSMTISLEASLKKLRTHYVDIFYVHFVRPLSSLSPLLWTPADSFHGPLAVGLGDLHRGDYEWPSKSRRLGQGPLSGTHLPAC